MSVLTGRVLVTAGHIQHPSLCSLSHSGIPASAGFAAAGCAWGVLVNQSHQWILEQENISSKNSSSRDRSNIQPRINNQGEVLPWGLHEPKQFRGSLMFSSSAKCLQRRWSIKNSSCWLPALCCQPRCSPCVQMLLKLNLSLCP